MEYDLDNSGDIGKSQISARLICFIHLFNVIFKKKKGHSKYVIKTEKNILHLH